MIQNTHNETGAESRPVAVPQERPGLLVPGEQRETFEARAEISTEQKPDKQEKQSALERLIPQLRRPKKVVVPIVRDEATLKIEKILEDGMGEAFSRLSPVAQQEFKLRGEETAGKIRELMRSTHSKAKQIFRLILEWLKILPGINKFFLEQEAKIKTDRIVQAQEQLHDEGKL